ncbi:MAG TPA: polymer-forming cytoskeletal protein [Gemmatimonadales bacterium]|nr:polymer-forming cytoskeletal protein [Gemmatimonadales bacterium]
MLAFLALVGVTLVWFLLPLLPALRELVRPTDIAPLKVVDRSAGLIVYFARNFRRYLDRVLPAEAGAGDYAAKLLDGTEFVRVNRRMEQLATDGKVEKRLVVLDAPLSLPGDQTFLMEVYARAPLVSGPETNYRAIYAERDLTLGENNRVFRWTHAGGPLTVGAHSILRGRVSSDTRVSFGADVVFERAGAPVIAHGEAREPPIRPDNGLTSWAPEGVRKIGDHLRIEGDLDIPKGSRVTGNLVVAGRLRIGAGALVEGSIKAHRDIELAEGAQVSGAAVSRARLSVGPGGWIGGPAIAERGLRLSQNAVVGGPSLPATVSATEVELAPGATVYGQISAMRGARTL